MREVLADVVLVGVGVAGALVGAEAFDVGAPALGVLMTATAATCFALVVFSRWPSR